MMYRSSDLLLYKEDYDKLDQQTKDKLFFELLQHLNISVKYNAEDNSTYLDTYDSNLVFERNPMDD